MNQVQETVSKVIDGTGLLQMYQTNKKKSVKRNVQSSTQEYLLTFFFFFWAVDFTKLDLVCMVCRKVSRDKAACFISQWTNIPLHESAPYGKVSANTPPVNKLQ